ncbi:MAG: endonuclease/exonuclease/phosphatase family protein [Nocardioides sp.]
MDEPKGPWLEAVGLVVILTLAAGAFWVSLRPGPTEPVATGTSSSSTPAARPAQEVVTGGTLSAAEQRAQRRQEDRGGQAVPRPQRIPGGVLQRAERCVISTDSSLEVASFNMRWGWNRDRTRLMLPTLAQEMAALQVDVLLLQEVDKNRINSGRVDQAAYLAGQLGMEYAFATNVLRPGDSRYGTAVLSAYPIVESANTLLPRPGGTQQRGLLRAVLEIAPGRRVSVYTTHFEHTSEGARIQQARAAAQVIAQDPYPAVVGGDMNSRPASTAMNTLRTVATDTWAVGGEGAGLTHPSTSPRSRIDYLLHRGDLGVNAVTTFPSQVSDHRAVRASYDLTPGAPDEIELPFGC